MTPNKKTEQFALSCKIRRSALHMMSWIMRRAKNNEICEIEIDLRIFNDWIAKYRGKPYDRKTIREACVQLNQRTEGIIVFLKSYSPWVHKILVRPLSWLERIKSQLSGKIPKLDTAQPMFDAASKNKAKELLLQNISRLDSFLRSLGMVCNQETLHRMWRYSGRKMSNIKDAVEYMLRCHKEKLEQSDSELGEPQGIFKPIGWLHDCLKFGRHLDVELNKPLPYFDSIMALSSFVTGIMPERDSPPISI